MSTGTSKHGEQAPPAIARESVELQLAQIMQSELFRRSERLRRFLQFSVAATLNGNSERTKEYVIGMEVFDRGSDFDPRIDPVVRVEARRLRAKLRQWHETEGRGASFVIELPTGTYAAVVRRRQESVARTSIAAEAKTIAVLPFANLNGDPDLDYFSDGLTEELIHALTRMPGLHVVAWPSAARMKGQEQDLTAIRQQLGVGNVLRGSIRRFGDHLRMTAQLLDTGTGHYLWSEAWDRSASDLLSIEQEIAAAIVLKLQPDAGDQTAPRFRVPSRNDESYNLYLKGRFHLNKRSPEGFAEAILCFERAIATDAQSALAWAALAESHALAATYSLTEPSVSMRLAERAADQAIALDPSLAEPVTCLAFLRGFEWRWKEAGELYRRSIALNPGFATAHHWYASDYLVKLGRFDEAIAAIERALSLDPLSSIKLEGRAYLSLVCGDVEDARKRYEALLQHDRWFYMAWSSLGRLYTCTGEYAKAIEMYERARSIAGDFPKVLGALGQTFGLAGRRDEAMDILRLVQSLSTKQHVGYVTFALIYLGLGEIDLTFEYLGKMVDAHELSATGLNVHPAWKAIQPDPRFRQLIERVGLLDFLP